MLIKIIKLAPDDLFDKAKNEIELIDFDNLVDLRSKRENFLTSKAVQLRTHKPPDTGPRPVTINEWSRITDTIDNPEFLGKYPNVINLCNWMSDTVGGISLGRIMIVNLYPKGTVGLHIDPLDYFEKFSRFHIPFKTNQDVLFKNDQGDEEHMPYKTLCRLNNRQLHGLDNRSNESRIHLIADIEVPGGNYPF